MGAVRPNNKETVAFNSKTGRAGGQLGEFVTATKLADAWLYCGFGHGGTDAPERAASHGLDAGFQAAVFLVANIALMAMTTLNFISDCVEAGLVPIDVSAFAEPVLARSEYTVMITAPATVAPDTPVAILEAALERLQQESANTDV